MAGLFGGAMNAMRGQASPDEPRVPFDFSKGLVGGFMAQRDGRAAIQQAQQQREQMLARGREIGLSEQEMFVLENAPADAVNALAERMKPQTIAPGSTGLNTSQGSVYTAPVMGMSGDQAYTQSPGSFNITGTRAPSFAEQSEADKRMADIERAIEQIGIAKGQLGVSQGQLGLNRQIHGARERSGGYGTPGVMMGGYVPMGE
jgi:hypothetical protein